MLIRPQTLSLITTHQCTAACDHCCFACTPKVTKAIPVERLHRLIDEAAAVSSIQVVVFTGGECFLLGKDLDDLIRHAGDRGFSTRCVTNGYWAVNEGGARERVARLKAAGLNEINFSTGSFHAKYVPVERIVAGAKACYEAGITTLIAIETHLDSDFDSAAIKEHPALSEGFASGRLDTYDFNWIPNAEGVGQATLRHRPEHSLFIEENKRPCESIMNVISVNPDQRLLACCGLHVESIPDLQLGSVAERTISDILDEASDNILKMWIHVAGPEAILEFVKRYLPDYELPTAAVHPCTTCHQLHRDDAVMQTLRAHYAEVEQEIVNAYCSAVASRELDRHDRLRAQGSSNSNMLRLATA